MPTDIRSFFGGKGAASPKHIKAPPRQTVGKQASAKPKGRGKRKVISDDEDEDEVMVPEATTVKQPQPKKRKESPEGEATTTSEYFGQSKPLRAEAPRKPQPNKKSAELKGPAPRETPKKVRKSENSSTTPKSARSARPSRRQTTKKNYIDPSSEDDDVRNDRVLRHDNESGEDVHQAEYVLKDRMAGYEESSDDDDVAQTDKVQGKPVKKKANGVIEKQARTNASKKRKSSGSSDDDDSEAVNSSKKKKNALGKPEPTKATPKKKELKKKEDVEESKEIQDIFDRIPTVKAPTPPPQDTTKKFNYAANAMRSQPAPLAGTKEVPTGEENCLAGLTFVFTGILDALGREDGQALVKQYGGKVTGAPSSKTNYVILGTDAGPKKLEMIRSYGLKTINEDGLFELIRKLPKNGGHGKAAAKYQEKQRADEKKAEMEAKKMEEEEKKMVAASRNAADKVGTGPQKALDHQLWTVRYAPTTAQQVCGNKTQVERLQSWLKNWRNFARASFKKGGPDGMGLFRAVMIHGPPGVGKTTAAHLAAKLEGYDIVESNASDTRSKKLVEGGLKGVLDTTSLLGYFAGDGMAVSAGKKKLVLIMDEVDGMSAGDRGGVGALASVCRKTNVPMILICNERRQPKMKPFDHVTFDMPFRRPTVDQVKGRIMTILHREGIKDLVPMNVIQALIEGTRADIRQIINMISTIKLDQESVNFDKGKKMAVAWEKEVILKPWDIVSKILGGGMFAQSSKATMNDKIELYFNDHEFAPLMLEENYLGTNPILSHPYSGKEKSLKNLELIDKAAASISDGDLCDAMIHGPQQQWSLMPTHAVMSFVRPASFVHGSQAGHQTRFTQYLGNLSKGGKLSRLVKEIQGHMRLRSSADRHEIRQQYLPVLWTRLVGVLAVNGTDAIDDVIDLMDSYFITKDDWDAIVELAVGPMDMEKLKIDSQAKSAFTRQYNKVSHPLPFMKAAGGLPPVKKDKEKPDLEEALEESEEDEVLVDPTVQAEEDEELDLKKDKYVSAPKKRKASAKKGKAAKEESNEVKVEDEESDSGKRGVARGKPKGGGKGKRKKQV